MKLEASADDDRLGKRDGAKASPPALLSKPKLPAGAALTAIGRVEHRLWLGSADGRLQIMDMASEKVVETRTGHRGAVSSIAHVHSAVWTAAADGLRVWDASSAKPTHHIPCSFSPAHLLRVGKTVWCGVRTEVIIYEATSYQLLRTLSLDLGPIAGLVLVGSSVWIALGRVLAKIDARTQTVVSYLQGHTLPINSLSTSGAELSTAADDGTVRVWNAKVLHFDNRLLTSLRRVGNACGNLKATLARCVVYALTATSRGAPVSIANFWHGTIPARVCGTPKIARPQLARCLWSSQMHSRRYAPMQEVQMARYWSMACV